MNDVCFYALIFLFGVFISACSQVLLKKSAAKHYDSCVQEYLNPFVITAYVIFVFAVFLSAYAYRGIPLSMGAVLETTSYLYVAVFGSMFFDEKISKQKILALVFIVSGVLIYVIYG